MTYRLQIFSKGSLVTEVFKEDLGYLYAFAQEEGYYGQRIIIHEAIEALDGYEELDLVDTFILTQGSTDPLTGSQRPLRKPTGGLGISG